MAIANNTNTNNSSSSTSNKSGSNTDIPQLIRYVCSNVAALVARRLC